MQVLPRVIPSLSQEGRAEAEIFETLKALRLSDFDKVSRNQGQFTIWAQAPTALGEAPFQRVAREAANLFFWDNQFFVEQLPSLSLFRDDIVRWFLELLESPNDAHATITMSGTESNMLAMKAARDWARATGRFKEPITAIAPVTAHASFVKAAEYFGMRVRLMPLAPDCSPDMAAWHDALDEDTAIIVGSAPEYCYGVVDPLEAFSTIAKERDLWFHIDACVGGTLAPFWHRIDPTVPRVGFHLHGVQSISIDIHKHLYGPMGTSILALRSKTLEPLTVFQHKNWPCGMFKSPTISGGRPANVLAATWAMLQFMGEEGVEHLAAKIAARRAELVAALVNIDGIKIMGRSHMSIVCYGSSVFDIYAVGDLMADAGWWIDRVQDPDAIHCIIDPFEDDLLVPTYVKDLRLAVDQVRAAGLKRRGTLATYG